MTLRWVMPRTHVQNILMLSGQCVAVSCPLLLLWIVRLWMASNSTFLCVSLSIYIFLSLSLFLSNALRICVCVCVRQVSDELYYVPSINFRLMVRLNVHSYFPYTNRLHFVSRYPKTSLACKKWLHLSVLQIFLLSLWKEPVSFLFQIYSMKVIVKFVVICIVL